MSNLTEEALELIKQIRENKIRVPIILLSCFHAFEYLKRKRKQEFSERQEMTGVDGKPLIISFDPIYNATTSPKTTGNS